MKVQYKNVGKVLLVIAIIVLFSGCSKKSDKGYESDFSKYFGNYTGSFVLYDVNNKFYIRHNAAQCEKRLSPCSTFKVFNSLAGLESGVIKDENFVIDWDGTQYSIESWNRTHNLKTAIANSVVWYYRELARRVGEQKMKEYFSANPYGNNDISGGIDNFWLRSSLLISANEQVEFLKKLYGNELKFSKRSMDIVKEIIKLDTTAGYVFSGKTGSAMANGKETLGWFVGHIALGSNAYIFATNIESEDKANGKKAKEITIEILKSLKIM